MFLIDLSWKQLAIHAIRESASARLHSVRAAIKRRVCSASSYCLSTATVCAEFIFSPGVGRPPEVAFALCSFPLPAQSDGFSDTIKSVADPADRQGSISARTGAGM
jgi:hypothetical protein